ncbi:MAG: HvfA family oxazolone/thioamide-modified RiPP metallophore [Nevskiales bacterium]
MKKSVAMAIGTAFVAGLSLTSLAQAGNPFASNVLNGGYQVAEGAEGKCGEGKCGEKKKGSNCDATAGVDKTGHCACGANKGKEADGKCGEGKCGEGKCGEKK